MKIWKITSNSALCSWFSSSFVLSQLTLWNRLESVEKLPSLCTIQRDGRMLRNKLNNFLWNLISLDSWFFFVSLTSIAKSSTTIWTFFILLWQTSRDHSGCSSRCETASGIFTTEHSFSWGCWCRLEIETRLTRLSLELLRNWKFKIEKQPKKIRKKNNAQCSRVGVGAMSIEKSHLD